MSNSVAKFKLIFSTVAFGTIGIFVHYINLPSSIIACVRGFIGFLFLLAFCAGTKQKIVFKNIKSHLLILVLSGAFIGFNWILLFEAYNYTKVATATLCYYMAPVFVIILSPFALKEKISPKKAVCVLVSLIGMVFMSGVIETGIPTFAEIRGVLLGLGAAMLYAFITLLNKKMGGISANDRTIVQLACAAIVILPYALITQQSASLNLTSTGIILLLIVGIVHTGICYALFFGSIKELPAQTVAVFSYIDPITAIILSAVILHEEMNIYGIIGAVLILGSALFSELPILNGKKAITKN